MSKKVIVFLKALGIEKIGQNWTMVGVKDNYCSKNLIDGLEKIYYKINKSRVSVNGDQYMSPVAMGSHIADISNLFKQELDYHVDMAKNRLDQKSLTENENQEE